MPRRSEKPHGCSRLSWLSPHASFRGLLGGAQRRLSISSRESVKKLRHFTGMRGGDDLARMPIGLASCILTVAKADASRTRQASPRASATLTSAPPRPARPSCPGRSVLHRNPMQARTSGVHFQDRYHRLAFRGTRPPSPRALPSQDERRLIGKLRSGVCRRLPAIRRDWPRGQRRGPPHFQL